MKQYIGMVALLVVGAGCIGCSSSDQAGGGESLDQVAATIQKPQASAAPAADAGSGAPANSAPASTPAVPASSRAPAPVPPKPAAAGTQSVAAKRGFALKDLSNEAAYVLVKADAGKVAELLAAHLQGQVIKDVLQKPVDEEKFKAVVYQFAGHKWSVFACDNHVLESLVPALGRDNDVIVYWNSDFSGWAGVELYRGGEQVEVIHWGGADAKLGEDNDLSKWDAHVEIDNNYDGVKITDQYLFRSKLRKATPDELKKGEGYVNYLFREHDAYLADVPDMPWLDEGSVNSPLGAAAFSGVYAVVDK